MKIKLISCPSGNVVLASEVNAYTLSELKQNQFDGLPHKVWGQCKIKDFPKGSTKVSIIDADLIVIDVTKRSNFTNFYFIRPDKVPELITIFEKMTGCDLKDGFYISCMNDIRSALRIAKMRIDDVLESNDEGRRWFYSLFEWSKPAYESMVYVPVDAHVITEDKVNASLKKKGELINTIEDVVGVIKLATTSKENANLAKQMLENVEYNKYLDIIPIVMSTYCPNKLNKLICINNDNSDFADFISKRKGYWRYTFDDGFIYYYQTWGFPHTYTYDRDWATKHDPQFRVYPEKLKMMMEKFTNLTEDEINKAYELIVREIPDDFTNFFIKEK